MFAVLYLCWVVYCSISVCSTMPMLGCPLLYLHQYPLCFYLIHVFCDFSAVYMPGLSTLSISFVPRLHRFCPRLCLMCYVRYSVCICISCVSALPATFVTRLLFVYLGYLFCLHSFCLIRSVYICICCAVPVMVVHFSVCICCAMPMLVVRCSFFVSVCYVCALSASFMACLVFVRMSYLLHLRSLYLIHSVGICVCCAYACACVFFLLCHRYKFFIIFLSCKS